MSGLQASVKSAVTVSEMAEMCSLSRSRFYSLMDQGVFPKPVLHPSSKRPMYDQDLQNKCLEVRRTGIGMNGVPVLFNRKPKKGGSRKVQTKVIQDTKADHGDLLDALKGLGLATTAQAVAEAVVVLYPSGLAGQDQGDVVRRVFLHLQGTKGGGR